MSWIAILIIWIVVAIIYTIAWYIEYSKRVKSQPAVQIIAVMTIWLGAPILLITDFILYVRHRLYQYKLKERIQQNTTTENREAERWEDQREAMFNAWKRKQEENEE